MQRPIKFRAWFEGKMRQVSTIHLPQGYSNSLEVEGNMGDAPLMQFTGLLDKNGKEIYEGDIISLFLPSANMFDPCCEVKFDNGEFYPDGFRHTEWGTYEYEVKGNIYQNPEMLKKD